MLSEEKVNVSDELLSHIVGEDAEKTKAAVEDFVKLFNEAVGEELKKSARQATPKEGGYAPSKDLKRWILEKWQEKPGLSSRRFLWKRECLVCRCLRRPGIRTT